MAVSYIVLKAVLVHDGLYRLLIRAHQVIRPGVFTGHLVPEHEDNNLNLLKKNYICYYIMHLSCVSVHLATNFYCRCLVNTMQF